MKNNESKRADTLTGTHPQADATRSALEGEIVADMRLEQIQALVAALSKEFYADDEMMKDAIEHKSSFTLIHYETAFKVDIFIRKSRAFDQMQLERRRTAVIATGPEQSVYVTSPEDVILALWGLP